jgi:hypothetical protein
VTVKDWIASRKPPAPPALMHQILRLLGPDAELAEGRTSERCLAAAARGLEQLLLERRFAREDASTLLAIDALTTYAFEYASHSATSQRELEQLADQGTRTFARLAEHV